MSNIVKTDLKDKKILRELDVNARIPLGKLAKKVGLSKQVTNYRINKLVEKGVIIGFVTIFDSVTVGKRWFRVLFQLKEIQKEEKKKFVEYFKRHPNVFWLGEVGGKWDFVINFVTDDQYTFNKLLETELLKWSIYVQRYEILVYINAIDQEKGYILKEYETEKHEFFHEMKFNPEIKLDELDKKIIRIISKDASLSFNHIGKQLKVSYKTVQNRIKEMEKNKIILGYRAMIQASKLGYEGNMIFLKIEHDPELEKKLYSFLKHSNVTFAVKHLGLWRIGIEVESSSRAEFHEFLLELRTRFKNLISDYETFPIFYDLVYNYFPYAAIK